MEKWEYEEAMVQWIQKAKDYPTQAILKNAGLLYKEQKKRLEDYQQRLDGQMWHVSDWKK